MKTIFFYFFILSSLFFCQIYSYSGDATVYAGKISAVDGAKKYNCGFTWLSATARTYYAALNKKQFNNSENCGKCATVRCTDKRCKSNKAVTVIISKKHPFFFTLSISIFFLI